MGSEQSIKVEGNTENTNVAVGDNIQQTIHHYGISPEIFAKYATDLGVTQNALKTFFKILEQKEVPINELDSKLREIAAHYKKLLENSKLLEVSDDASAQEYLCKAQQFIEGFDEDGNEIPINFDKADELLQQAFELHQANLKKLKEIQQQTESAIERNQLASAQIMAQKAELAEIPLQYKQAANYFQQAAELLPEGYEEEKAEYLNNAGFNFKYADLYEQALPLYQQASRIWEEVLGKQHPDYATSLNNLALLYYNQGLYEQALPLHQQALTIREQVLGKQHPDYATSLSNLALLYDNQGLYEQALPLHQQALTIHEQVLGKQHPLYANTLNNLAALYQSQGEYEQSLLLYEQVLTIREQILGEQHPDYATSLNNLAALYQLQEEYEKALPLYQQALEIVEQVLGGVLNY